MLEKTGRLTILTSNNTMSDSSEAMSVSVNPSAAPAHALYIDLVTRITTQRLHYRSGDEETAAASIYTIFRTTRDLMTKYAGASDFQTVALILLNDILRPNTARWHGWMTQDGGKVDKDGRPILKFRDEWVRRKFREELRELQPFLLGIQKYLHALSLEETLDGGWLNPKRGSDAHRALQKECEDVSQVNCLGLPIPLKIRTEVPLFGADLEGIDRKSSVICKMETAERQFIFERRQATGHAKPSGEVCDIVGLALSGGGIRSATFCLGIVQVLQRHGLFNQVDYLSTVSGGGYLGTFLSSFLSTKIGRNSEKDKPPSRNSNEPEEIAHHAKELPDDSEQTLIALKRKQALEKRVTETLGRSEPGLPETAPIRHLRNNSKYLLNGGGWGLVSIAAVFATGFLASLLMLLTIPLLMAWVTLGIKSLSNIGFFKSIKLPSEHVPTVFEQPLGPLLASFLAILALVWVFKLLAQRFADGEQWNSKAVTARSFFEAAFLIFGVASLTTLGVCFSFILTQVYEALREMFATSRQLPKVPEWLGGLLAAAVPTLFGILAKRKDGSSRKWAECLFYLTGPLFFILAFAIFASHLGVGSNASAHSLHIWAIVTAALLIWAFVCLNINTFAPHRYYRDRLCECFLAVPDQPERSIVERGLDSLLHGKCVDRDLAATSVGAVKFLPLTEIGDSLAAPYHLINAALNAEASKNPELRGRNGDFFLFSRHFCGCPLTGYIPTKDMQRDNPGMDLGTAMAISGAAASTNMGSKTLRSMRFLMTLFNVRLGYWMRRPGSKAWPKFFDGPGPIYFIREMLGAVHERSRYVNLSDGGHIENLAAYELLRRQSKFIVCIDAGMEPGMECSDLMRLQRYASIDLGIQMHFDPTDLTLLPTNYSRAYAILVKIDYAPDEAAPPRQSSDKLGWMLYLKLAITGTEPRHVLDYRRQHPDFPHQSTGDQFYDEAQFESYRALGECAAESLFRDEITGSENSGKDFKVADWFQRLAENLLPDNDEVFS
jgi:hypothetical protein